MATKKNLSVNPHPDGWEVRRDGSSRASHVTERKEEAVEKARAMAQRDKVELTIRREDGQIHQKDSYGNDLMPPRDTEH